MYIPADAQWWQGRVDEEDGEAGYRWHQAVRCDKPTSRGVSVIGLASDLGVTINKGRAGAIEGPSALRQAMANQAWYHDIGLFDDGDIEVGDDLASGQQAFAQRVATQLHNGQFVLGLGGGHEIGWASYRGCRQWMDENAADKTLGILNFDAHFDLRKPAPLASSGTPFYQVRQHCIQHNFGFHYGCMGIAKTANTRALFSYASESSVSYLQDVDCTADKCDAYLRDFLSSVDCLYLTLCLDVLPAASAPGVSAPAALGVNPFLVIDTIAAIGRVCREYNINWLMADIAELSPVYDISNRTAKLAARMADEIVCARFPVAL